MCALSYSSFTGPVENPWAVGFSTGGSSSGCGALLAVTAAQKWHAERGLKYDVAEGIELAVGCDQGGSIRLVSTLDNQS